MALPQITVPQFDILIPSKDKKFSFRSFLVKEEKILLMAAESDDQNDVVKACRQIVNNCCLDDLDVDTLATFDLDYVFIKLRSKSVNNICKMAFRDNEDEKVYDFEVDLESIELQKDPTHTNKINITDDIVMVMKYPTVDIADGLDENTTRSSLLDKLVLTSIDKIYDKETVYEDYTPQELSDFLDNLSTPVYDKIRTFFDTMPRVYHKVTYTNKLNHVREIELTTLQDFFNWG